LQTNNLADTLVLTKIIFFEEKIVLQKSILFVKNKVPAKIYAFKNGIFWSRLTQKYNRSTYFPHGKKTTARGEKFLKRRVLSDSTF